MTCSSGRPSRLARGPRRRRSLLAGGAGAIALAAVLVATISAGTSSAHHVPPQRVDYQRADGLGIRPGKIKHVWLIILENKSYDASFTGLNNNTYLWQTLPAQGVLLKNYFGTGHFSLDNYISMVSGQATQPDTQADCPFYDQFSGSVDTSGTLETNPNYGQVASAAGPNAIAGSNGCVYGSTVQTLFNQLDAAHVSWKGYAQDLNAAQGDHSVGPAACGAPFATPGATGSKTQANPGSANATDQYVPKHFPFPWFESVLQSGDCNPAHIADVFDASNGLYHDLQSASHDAGIQLDLAEQLQRRARRRLQGQQPLGRLHRPEHAERHAEEPHRRPLRGRPVPLARHPRDREVARVQGRRPDRHHVRRGVPALHLHRQQLRELDAHRAERRRLDRVGHGRRDDLRPHRALRADGTEHAARDRLRAATSSTRARATTRSSTGRTRASRRRHRRSPPARASSAVAAMSRAPAPTAARPRHPGSPRFETTRSSQPTPDASVTGTGIPAGAFVSQVTDASNAPDIPAGGPADTGLFTIVDSTGAVLTTTAAVSGVTLGARTPATDPLYNATDPTNGGGDTGSVLISPFIRPGTVSNVYYNHYSWLRTMEDIFGVGRSVAGPRRSRPPRLRRPAGPRAVRVRRLQQPVRVRALSRSGRSARSSLEPGVRARLRPATPARHGVRRRRRRRRLGRVAPGPGRRPCVGAAGTASSRAGSRRRRCRWDGFCGRAATHPRLAIQGDSVSVHLSHGTVLATTVGPEVPETGKFPVPPTSPCSFTVTLTAATGTVPVEASAITILDELGHVHHPRVTALHGGDPARPSCDRVRRSRSSVRDVLPTGGGRLRWAPEGSTPIASWDFDVEID